MYEQDNEKFILAIDLGTSGPKVALMSTDGVMIGCEIEETQLVILPHGGAEQDPNDWWRSIAIASQRLIQNLGVSIEKIISVSCTAQWSGTVAVDRNGNHLMNAIIWMDSRGAPYVKKITDGFMRFQGFGLLKALKWINLTGGIPTHSGKDPIAHILYIKHRHPDVYENTYKFLEPKDYLNLRLTGVFAASYESVGLYWLTDNRDINNIHYNQDLIKMSGIDPDKLPELKRSTDIVGNVKLRPSQELGIFPSVPVVVGTPDVQSAAIGSGAIQDYKAHLYLGTSSWLSCHVPFKKTNPFHNIASLPSGIPGKYFVADEQETAGACLTFLRDNILYPDDKLQLADRPNNFWDRLNATAAQVPPGKGRVIFTPWLFGERTPIDDHKVRGGFFNISLDTTRAHLVRAILEGIAFNSRWLLITVEKFIKRHIDEINIIGGGANSDLWCQIHADILNRTIKQVKNPVQANARGAAYLACVGLNFCTFDDIQNRTEFSHTYEPNAMYRKFYDDMFAEFVNIYKNNKKMYARLAEKSYMGIDF